MPTETRPLIERWTEKVEKHDPDCSCCSCCSGCWHWRGAIKSNGYGVIQRGSRGEGLVRAHRFAYEHFVGPIPSGLEMRHSCHLRHCVNPEHLTPGTRAENMRDMDEAGRRGHRYYARGERISTAKLTEDDVRAIRVSEETGLALGSRYGVSQATVSEIKRGVSWRHVPA